MPASKTKRTIYMSEARKQRLLKLDPDATFSQLINRAVAHYYDTKIEELYIKKQKRERFKDV